MAKIYLENKKFYVKNENNLVYKVGNFETYDGYDTLHLNLELVAGLFDDKWIKAGSYPEEVQTETVIVYMMEESIKESLEANDYEILKEIDGELQKIIDEYNR